MSGADEWLGAAASMGLLIGMTSLGYEKSRQPLYDRRKKPEPTIKVHQLSRHSFTATVDVPLVNRLVRVRGTTRRQTLSRARWVRKNYWRLAHAPKGVQP